MSIRSLVASIGAALVLTGVAHAEAPLEQKLDLTMDQAKAVAEVEAEHRAAFRSVRGDLMRKLREQRAARHRKERADAEALELEIQPLREALREIRMREYAAIRAVLNAEQLEKYEALLVERHSVGRRSADDKLWLD